MCKWAKAFREGRTSLADDSRSGRPPIPDGVEGIHAKAEGQPYQSGSAMARHRSVSKTYVLEILKTVLRLKKYSLRCVGHTFNDDQKAARAVMAA
jgi:hypothetical protein